MIASYPLKMSNSDDVALPTDYGLDALAAVIHETAIQKGFWDGPISHDKIVNKIALAQSEIVAIAEFIRKNKGSEKIVGSMVTVLIRLLDLYGAMRNATFVEHGLDEMLLKKMKINEGRQRLHENLF